MSHSQLFDRALDAQRAGNLVLAEQLYQQLIAEQPKLVEAINNLASVFIGQKRYAEAIAAFEVSAGLDPERSSTYNGLGIAWTLLGDSEKALAEFTLALEIDPSNVKALNNIGDALTKLRRFDEAREHIERGIARNPAAPEIHNNLGLVLWELGLLEEAVRSFRRAIALKLDYGTARTNLALVLMSLGQYREAWPDYEWRSLERAHLFERLPRWVGEPIARKKIFVWREQGVGDELFYFRYASALVALGANVIWQADPRLTVLFRNNVKSQVMVADEDKFSNDWGVHVHCSAASLPRLFSSVTAGVEFVNSGPYLRGSIGIRDKIKPRINPNGEKVVGICWRSTAKNIGAAKSTDLGLWEPILAVPGVRFINLQHGETTEERAGRPIHHLQGLDLKNDFPRTTALISLCDHVVTVSSTTAHLACALGVRTTVLLPANLGRLWYWGLQGDRTPWYPTAELVRQSIAGSWEAEMQAVAEKLRAL